MTDPWRPRFACPECCVPASGDDPMRCDACGRVFERQQGIYRFLPAARPHLWERFVEQYRLVREREGYRPDAPDYYRHLPSVPHGDPAAAIWRIRRESYAHLQRHALPAVWRGPIRILDLGAGCGWLSHRLASCGHHVVAVDRLDDERDGLGVCRHYPVALTAVQADFDALPFDAGQFDLIVFDAALHYAKDPARTLDRTARALSPGGVLAVVDSPMFADDETGRSMVADEDRRLRAEHGVEDVVRPGLGYLTFEALDRAAAALGLRSRFVPSTGPLGWRARRQVARWRIGRSPAAFGVWVAG